MASKTLDEIVNSKFEIDMTPMIDCVFQLIIFFMVVSKMSQDKLEALILPVASSAIPDKGVGSRRMIINVDKDGTVKIDGRRFKMSELDSKFELEVLTVDGSMEQALANGGSKVIVLLRADQDTQYYHIQEVIRKLSFKFIFKIDLAVKPANKT